jgi:uncharacterized protein (DUF983 family)
MRHPVAFLIGLIIVWLMVVISVVVQPIVWWHTALWSVVGLMLTVTYVRERKSAP